jgi:hypothetical protein
VGKRRDGRVGRTGGRPSQVLWLWWLCGGAGLTHREGEEEGVEGSGEEVTGGEGDGVIR